MSSKSRVILPLFFLFLLLSCDNLFLRFKYETYECKPNRVDLKKVFIKDYKEGDVADVEVGEYLYKFKISFINKQKMYLVGDAGDFVIKIYRKTGKVEARLNNLILNVECNKSTFKM
ncbi:MAG: hypothetical protein ACJ0G4_05375 [Alphaproteobacteria bacterium]